MSFRLGDIIVKEILYGVAFDLKTQNPLYVLTQLSEATINITAEAVDVTDKNGNIVKKIYRSKSGEFSATNAFLNANLLQQSSGNDAVYAGVDGKTVVVPMMLEQKAALNGATTIKLNLDESTDDSTTVKINQLFGDGTLGGAVTNATIGKDGTIVIPEGANGDAVSYFVSYEKTFTSNAIEIANRTEDFPDTVKMVFKVAYYDPCNKDSIKSCYIVIENFMISPETSISLSSDSKEMSISATIELSYCDGEKVLYKIFFFDEDDDDDAIADETP